MYAIILAGGSGSRLWPLSRELYPKQLLKLTDNESLLQATFNRVLSLTDKSKIVIMTNIEHSANVKMQLEKLAVEKNIVSEPASKNTAPAIACAVKYVQQFVEDDIVIVMPSDHLIKNIEKFKQTVKHAEKLAKEGYIVTFGITPSYAETGFGYICTSNDSSITNITKTGLKVDEFKEKPDKKTAEKYIEQGNYFWNSGMFMFKISTMMKELEKHSKEINVVLEDVEFDKFGHIPFMIYDKMPNISIDYAVMEKTDKIALVPLESDWNDVGSWQSLYDIKKKDKNMNVIAGKVIAKDCKNSLVYGNSKLVSAIGLDNVIVVETQDAVLVCDKNKTQQVKEVYDELKKTKNDLYLVHQTVYRPWGFYTCIEKGDGYLTKIIQVAPRQQLSYQMHYHRSEHWVVLSGKAKVILDDKEYLLNPGQSIDIPKEAKHSLQNPFFEDLKILEVQLGRKLIEEDIVRFQDIYGRAGK